MVEYKLIRGVRHYRMAPGERWKVDNVSQKEGEERLIRPSSSGKTTSQIKPSPQRKNYSQAKRRKKKCTWLWVLFVIGILTGIFYNHYDLSLEENFIQQYMEEITNE